MTRAPGSTWAVTKGRDARGPFEAGAASPTRVRADLERAVQALGGDAVLLRGEHPAGREPHGERRSPAIEEGPCRHRGPATAGGTLVAAIGDRPSASVTAPRADEALGPPQPVQVVQAVGVGREPGLELPDGPRVVPARPGLERTIHALSLVRSDEYPPTLLMRIPGSTRSLTRWSARRARPGDCPAVSPGTTIGKTLAMATERLDLIKQRTSLGVEP